MEKTKYMRNNETISGRLHDELVMMDISKGKYFSLNPVATFIWDNLEDPISLDDLCSKLVKEYEVEPEKCRIEVQAYLNELQKLNLIVTKPVTNLHLKEE